MQTTLGVVLVCHFLAAFTVLGVPLFLPRLLHAFGIGENSQWIGGLFSLPTIMTALTAPWWGRFADKYGRRLSLQRALLGLTCAFVMAGMAPSLPWLIFALLLQGIAGGTLAAANGYLSVSLRGESLAKALNWTQFSARLALLSAPPLLGWILGEWPDLSLRLWLWLALLPLSGFVLSLFLPAEGETVPVSRSVTESEASHAALPLAPLLGLQFLFNFTMVVTFPYFLPYAKMWLGEGLWIGVFYSWPHLLYLVLLPLLQRFPSSSRHFLYGNALIVVSAIWHNVLDSAPALLAARTLLGIGILLGYSGINQLISQATQCSDAGHWFGRLDALGKWAGVMAGLCAGWLCTHWSFATPYIASAVAASLALMLFLLSPFKEPQYVNITRRS
ncbi:MFS transporter [Prodigiosinella confusarubida]|uniref:MFS transporter n=1 Tax=Serratia sp. (strain ATCC 39006) TaxID=104623 RepID=A0A2I5TH23_SERS3|nr:MFS transporter [Serratia sp. ATCC 39006]AUG99556.1 MFS transporter [Serratia sp. ATCC 39006]AUH03874.1 MFS transporter [Serratia sp. ATCC 39006]